MVKNKELVRKSESPKDRKTESPEALTFGRLLQGFVKFTKWLFRTFPTFRLNATS